MICVDTSCWIPYLAGESGEDLDVLDGALARRSVVMAPVVLTELLSAPNLSATLERRLVAIDLLEPKPGYWRRAGKLRAVLLKRGLKPKLADTLIAQSCIDYQAPLLCRDSDFRTFVAYGGLVLL